MRFHQGMRYSRIQPSLRRRGPSLILAAVLALGLGGVAPRPAQADAATDVAALLDAASTGRWAQRWAAVRRLAGQTGSAQFAVRAALLRDRRPEARAAIAWACSLEPDLATATLLASAIKREESAAVRRGLARALARFKDRRAIGALIGALASETDARTKLHIVSVLRTLTPAPCLMDASAWQAWWKKHAHDPRFAPTDQPPTAKEYDGVRLETRTVAQVPTKKPTRAPPHLLVLPPFGWNTNIFGPYLTPLREVATITWVTLPSVQKLTGRSGYGDDLPTYPVARLVRALEKFREQRNVERFVLIAPGASGWFAMRYALDYPKQCAGLILIDTALDKAAYRDILQRAAARGTKDERFVAKTLMGQNSVPFNKATLNRMHGITMNRSFLEAGDLEAAWTFGRARVPQGFASVPDIAWARHRKVDVPALFLYSGVSGFSGHRHADRIQRHFRRSLVAPIKECYNAPYIERNLDFHRVVRTWLKKFELIE